MASNNPHSTVISTLSTKINKATASNSKIQILVFKTHRQKVLSIHSVNSKAIIITIKIIASTIKTKINFKINKILNFNLIISNLVNLINKVIATINLEINLSINQITSTLSNLTIILETQTPISIQASTAKTIITTILIVTSIISKINKIKALTWAASAASCCAGTVKSCEIGEYYDSLTASISYFCDSFSVSHSVSLTCPYYKHCS